MVDLYRYFPTFIKMRDRLASQLDFTDPREAVLKKLVYMIEQMFDDTDQFIQTLLSLNDPDAVEQKYFSHISYLLGTMLPNGANEDEIRFIIKQLVNHYKTSGTHPSWHTAWHWSDQPDSKVVELYKREPYEIANYSVGRSANHPLKSARIQLGICASTCESICVNTCESSCEAVVEVGAKLATQEALRRLAYVEYLRPIHVILRQDAEVIDLQSGFPGSQDTIGHYPEVYGVEPDPWLGSEGFGDFQNVFFTADDEFSVDVECVALCEVTCQSCCEAVCECNPCEVTCQAGSCQESCTAGCQAGCEFPCEAACQFDCAALCQAGTCTAECAGACLSTCQGSCANVCQASCTDGTCETQYCEGDCQGSCANECQASCTGSSCETQYCIVGDCQGGFCTASCQDSCQTLVMFCPIRSCQGSCEASCQVFTCQFNSCQGSCETSCQYFMCQQQTCQTSGGETS